MPAAVIGVILFGLGVVARMESKFPRLRPWFFFGSGCTIGIGLLSHLVSQIVRWFYHAGDVATTKIFGASAVIGLVIAGLFWLFLKLIPKGSSGHDWADFIMFLLPAILTAAGGSWALLTVDGTHATTSIVNSVISGIQQVASGW